MQATSENVKKGLKSLSMQTISLIIFHSGTRVVYFPRSHT